MSVFENRDLVRTLLSHQATPLLASGKFIRDNEPCSALFCLLCNPLPQSLALVSQPLCRMSQSLIQLYNSCPLLWIQIRKLRLLKSLHERSKRCE